MTQDKVKAFVSSFESIRVTWFTPIQIEKHLFSYLSTADPFQLAFKNRRVISKFKVKLTRLYFFEMQDVEFRCNELLECG